MAVTVARGETPAVFWASDPVRPGETAMVIGENLGGGDTVCMGGRNIEITGCDFYGTGRALFLSRVRGGRVAGNRFFNGRWGWYCLSGSDGLIFEDNTILGADLMSTGGDPATTQTPGFFAGDLDDVKVWTRALTSDEIQAEFAKGGQ